MKKKLLLLLILILSISLFGCAAKEPTIDIVDNIDIVEDIILEDGYYTRPEEVSLYLNTYEKLPNNYILKKDAIALGWDAQKGNLWDVTEKMSIGGDSFGNREGILPKADKRKYYECDVNYSGGHRGAERLVYSNDGLIYYTKDHYKTFNLLYGDE